MKPTSARCAFASARHLPLADLFQQVCLATIFQADDASYLVEELPLLTHLILTGGIQGTLAGGRLDLLSESLEFIDISNSAKGLTFERLECPSLRELRCSNLGGYGNGLVPRDPTGSGSWWWERPGPGVCDQPCKFTQSSFLVGSQQPDCPLIDLPEQCVVYWSGARGRHSREIRATSTTTYGELYDCTGPL